MAQQSQLASLLSQPNGMSIFLIGFQNQMDQFQKGVLETLRKVQKKEDSIHTDIRILRSEVMEKLTGKPSPAIE